MFDTINSRTFTFIIFDISVNVTKSGCDVLVHHLDTVAGSLPTCYASHFPVCPVSANTALIRLSFRVSSFIVIISLIELERKFSYFYSTPQIFGYAFN